MSKKNLTITLAQLNPTVGDIDGNISKIRKVFEEHKETSDLIVYSEMIVSGYPTDDLVLKPFFIDHVMKAVDQFAKETKGSDVGLLISAPWRSNNKVYNAALLIHDGKVIAERYKHNLPNYGVFDEVRLFSAGELPLPIEFKGVKLGVMTCEDMWLHEVTPHLKEHGAEMLIVLNGSPFEIEKINTRIDTARKCISGTSLPLIYVNQVGGQDELVFDGASFVIDAQQKTLTQLPEHREYVSTTVWKKDDGDKDWICKSCEARHTQFTGIEAIYQSLVLGLRDYINKNGFPGIVIGMSGGVDSALSAAIAADAIGADKVKCIMMPSPYTSKESIEDAQECSEMLGINHSSVGIQPAIDAYDTILKDASIKNEGVTAENIQARSRGMLLMAVSNATGYMVLSTGNKSEMSVGYATLYGDMCGGFNALKDVYKTTVFELCHWRNKNYTEGLLAPQGRVIPERIITKPPSAELRPDQKDEDSLPPYDELDDILYCLIEKEMNIEEITSRGHSPQTVNKIWKLLDRAQYKRRQACPGVKISSKAFGRDRRYPITNKFTDILN